MSRTLRWTLWATLGCFVFLLARFPAVMVVRFLPPNIALAGVKGSIWNGGATALGVNGLVTQERLSWKFDWPALLHGRVAWQIHGEHAGQPGELLAVLDRRGPALEKLHLALPLEPLTQFNPILTGVRLRGDVILESERVARKEAIRLDGGLQHIGSAMADEPMALGSYRFSASATPTGEGRLEVSTINGPLQIRGEGNFDPATKKGRAKLHLKPDTDLPGISPLLATLPREGDDYILNYPR